MSEYKKTLLSSLLVVGGLMGGTAVAAPPSRATSLVAASSHRARAPHVTISYQEDAAAITIIYAVSKETLREEKIWAQRATPSWRELRDWLQSHGGKPDCQHGPAIVRHDADGSAYEGYYRKGLLDREDGPARIGRGTDGWAEEYWRKGLLDREDGPARLGSYPDGSTYEEYWRGGQPDRQDGPAIIERNARGAIIQKLFYEKGHLIREERPAPSSATPPGVMARPPAPGPA